MLHSANLHGSLTVIIVMLWNVQWTYVTVINLLLFNDI